MKAPSVAPNTASQVFGDTEADLSCAGAALACGRSRMMAVGAASIGVWSAVMGVSSWLAEAACIGWQWRIIRKKLEGLSSRD